MTKHTQTRLALIGDLGGETISENGLGAPRQTTLPNARTTHGSGDELGGSTRDQVFPSIGGPHSSGEAETRGAASTAGVGGTVELKLSAKRFLITALATKDDELARFALSVIRYIVEGESH